MRGIRTLAATAALTVPLALAGASPAFADGNGPVRPVLECVAVNGDGSYTAVFGSYNPSANEITILVGPQNFFEGDRPDMGQPTVFAGDRQVAAFSLPFHGGSVTWNLAGRTATASPESPPCNSGPEVSEAGMPVVLAVAMAAMGSGWLWRRRRLV
jgi:uncharacterized protein (TIGR03382 family)